MDNRRASTPYSFFSEEEGEGREEQEPQRPKRHTYTTRDQRLQAITLDRTGMTARQIARELNITRRQVQYAKDHPPTPEKRSGRPSVLTSEEVDEIEAWVCSSKEARRTRWDGIPQALGLDHSHYTIRRALRKRGFCRRVARRKPPISEVNRLARLAWAEEHVNWTREQWSKVLWTDETWQNGSRHTKMWVTRRTGEEYDPTCIWTRTQRRGGFLFWGSFAGITKGPTLFWEKDWGTINSETYRQKILPLIGGWIILRGRRDVPETGREPEELVLMQDSAPGHAARETIEDLEERGIIVIPWPAYSPDLNPIETLWNWMKDWIQNTYGDDVHGYDAIRRAVTAAWDAVPDELLAELIESMPARCQAVIDANGMHTRY
jgi:transposase